MVKTFANIWLNAPKTPDEISLVSSSTTLFSFLDVDLDDLRGINKPLFEAWSLHSEDVEPEMPLYQAIPSSASRQLKMLKSARMSIINNCILQLTIITSPYKAQVDNYSDAVLLYRTLGERYGFHVKTKYEEIKLGEKYTNHHKIQKDVKCIIHLLEELREDFEVFGAATSIDTFIENYYRMRADEAELMIELAGKRETYKQLVKTCRNIRGDTKKCFEEMNKIISKKAVEMKDEMEFGIASVNFTEQWEASRREQNSMVLGNKEGHFQSIIDGNDDKMMLEDVCHETIEKYINEAKIDAMDEIEHWMDVYDRECDERDMKIYKMKNATEKLNDQMRQLQEQFDRRAKEIDDWKEYKRLKRERAEREALEAWAIVKIQAWWRGVMVRKKLGPFGRKMKGKKGDKKNKKKKKSKK